MSEFGFNPCDLLFHKPIEFVPDTVYIRVPTVEEVAYNPSFGKYVGIFTISTREMFATARNVDELEAEFPTVMDMFKDPQADMALGQIMGVPYKGSEFLMEALNFWTGLQAFDDKETPEDDRVGFQVLTNGKIIHFGTQWVITKAEFEKFSKIIKVITCFTPSEHTVPKITSDTRHKIWLQVYKGRQKAAARKALTLADKILILSISMESYIPIEEIRKMSIFTFNRLFEGLSKKEGYEKQWDLRLSMKFKTDDQQLKHWKETFKIDTISTKEVNLEKLNS